MKLDGVNVLLMVHAHIILAKTCQERSEFSPVAEIRCLLFGALIQSSFLTAAGRTFYFSFAILKLL